MSGLNDQLKDIFDSAEFQPTDKVWTGVEKALKEKKKAKSVFWMWQTYATAAAILFIGAFAFILNYEEGASGASSLEQKNEQLTEILKDSTEQRISLPDSVEKLNDPITKTLMADVFQKDVDLKAQSPASLLTNQMSSGQNDVGVIDDLPMIFENRNLESLDRAELKAYRESLARQKLAFQARMNFKPFSAESTTTLNLIEEERSRGIRINGGLGSGTFNSGESNAFAMAAAETANVDFSSLSVAIENGEERVESVISVGAGVNFELSNKLSLDAGARFSNFRIASTSNAYSVENGIALPVSLNVPFDATDVQFVGTYGTTNTFQSVFIQSALNYRIVSFGKFDLNTRMGVGVDYFFNYRFQGDLNFLSERRVDLGDSDINPLSFSLTPGIGLNYRINDQFGLGIDASYRRFLSSSSVSVNGGTSIFGFGFSLNYLITKD